MEAVETTLTRLREWERKNLTPSTVPKSQGIISDAKMYINSFYQTVARNNFMSFLGTEQFLAENKAILSADHGPVENSKCNKDTGDKQKALQKWSRGLMHFVRGSGFIDSWSPLFV